jgi:hypothetical protein
MITAFAAPAGFTALATTPAQAELSGDLHRGPAAGTVETSWSPEEGVLVYVGDSDGMSMDAANQLLADLRGVLGRVAGL